MVRSTLFSLAAATAMASLAAAYDADCTFTWDASSGDNCLTMALDFNLSLEKFIFLNKDLVGDNCSKGVKPGVTYCVESPNDPPAQVSSTTTSTTSKTSTTSTTIKSTSAPITSTSKSATKTSTTLVTSTTTAPPSDHSPTQDGVISTCNNWYKVRSGDNCQKIVDAYGTFTLKQFYSWNPAVGSTCASLALDYYVCVGVPGISTAKPTTTQGTGNGGHDPVQTGVASDCTKWYQVQSNDSCEKIRNQIGTFELSDFYKWNPAVGSSCSTLLPGYWVCVDTASHVPSNKPSPVQAGTPDNCNKWYKAVDGDVCQTVTTKNKINLVNLRKWNPAVGTDCAGLIAGYNYCVGVSS